MAPFLKKSLGRGWQGSRGWPIFLGQNLSLSLFSLGRNQEECLGFMRVLAWEFDVNHSSHA
jgi:hypothetical protein